MRRVPTIRSSSLSDADVVAGCVRGDAEARDELVSRFGRLVHATIARTLGRHDRRVDEDRLADLFAGAYVALIEHDCRRLGQWDGRCSLASWVRLVAASTTLDALRAEGRASRLRGDAAVDVERLPLEGQDALDRAIRAERVVRLERALATLSASDRALLGLVFQEEVAPGEVALRLGIEPGAVYTRKNRALERLRKAFEAAADDTGGGA